VAIDLDQRARDFVAGAVEQLRVTGVDGRFESPEKWHVTIAFLGATPPDRYAGLLRALREAAEGADSFEVVFDTLGAFPSNAPPRIVWVGSSVPQPAFAHCAARVRESMERIGYRFDDDAVLHVTVCRIKRPVRPLDRIAVPDALTMSVDALTLYESLPTGPTTRYAVRERVPLRNAEKRRIVSHADAAPRDAPRERGI
jgi:RNA 2',3'-cyclic 3'-phosphodiesterase